MTVIKEWNAIGSSWQTILIGEQGPQGEPGTPGGTGATGPAGPIGAGLAIRGAYFGTSTPLPATPATGDLWILGAPLPTLAPDRPDASAKAAGDGMAWDGTAWVNTGPIQGPRGFAGGTAIGITTDATGNLLAFRNATPVAKAANPGTATGTNAAIINAIVTCLRDHGMMT